MLPKGVKQMLLVTESVFFDEARVLPKSPMMVAPKSELLSPEDVNLIHLPSSTPTLHPPSSLGLAS